MAYMLQADRGLYAAVYGRAAAPSWLKEAGATALFAFTCDQERIDSRSEGMMASHMDMQDLEDGGSHLTLFAEYKPKQIHVEFHAIVYPDSTVLEQWFTLRNGGAQPVRISRLDSISLEIPDSAYELMYFTGSWGMEFESMREALHGERVLETRHGRSSQGQHPWFALFRSDGEILSASVKWSGNWVFRFEPHSQGGYQISGGLHDWEFFKDLEPGATVESVPVVIVLGSGADLNTVSMHYARIGRKYWYPRNELSQSLPVEWNHWWSYRDKLINEEIFKQNVDSAMQLGVEVCTLDAGWFGPTEPGSHWYNYRGDWDLVNTIRFPSGIRALADYVHSKKMKFGLWCEIEGLGKDAELAQSHPEYVALRDGERLGYVCFGNPAAQEWAFATLDRLIQEYACDWIKLDFNLAPGSGCDRTDHGHGAGDGLYAHYHGYYQTLRRIRERHPGVVLENCSSGGLRIDLGILQQTHLTFLSDPDWPEHSLQLAWGASTMLAPNVGLRWGYCEWIYDPDDKPHRYQHFNPRDPHLTRRQLDYYSIISQLGLFGFSQKLPELPEWVAARFAYHTRQYQQQIKRFIREGDFYRLTEQPRRFGLGERWVAFQSTLPEPEEHLLWVFRLHGAAPERVIHLTALQPEQLYRLTWLNEERVEQQAGHALMQEGVKLSTLVEEEAAVVHLKPIR
jgi:alpha-galactosidase